MLFEPNVSIYDGFGIIDNSIFPTPEAFIIQDIANQNTFNSLQKNECKDSSYYNYHHNYIESFSCKNDGDYNIYDDEEEEYDE